MAATVWSSGVVGRLTLKSWPDDELGLVFDAVTGDTHLILQSAVEVLQSLEKNPCSVESLVEQLLDRFAPEDQGNMAEFITTTLLQLKDIGLVFDIPV